MINKVMPSNKTHFGYTEVTTEKKQSLVNSVFTSVAGSYDIMNDLMSLGIHRVWKKHFVYTSGIKSGDQVLDLAGGTGDISLLLMPTVGKDGHITLSDINHEMLTIGEGRLIDHGYYGRFDTCLANAEDLPLSNNQFDAVTMAFGLRNVTDKTKALKEIYRVLKPGGKLLVLEFSKVNTEWLKKIYDVYSFKILPKIGEIVAKDRDSYQYLVESIRKHPDQQKLQNLFEQAGFESCSYNNLNSGIVAIHKGYKV